MKARVAPNERVIDVSSAAELASARDMKDPEAAYELSPVQEGMLFHTLHEPDAAMYFQQSVSAMRDIDIHAFERAWRYLIQRHTILRTSFHWQDRDRPVQIVHRSCPFSLDRLDWRSVPGAERMARLRELLREDRKRGIQLDRAPLLRMTVIQLDERDFYYLRSHHHILLDGWSGQILLQEFRRCYESLKRNRKPDLPTPRPYGDYIAWLRRQDLSKANTYWHNLLRGFGRPTPLPEDHSGDRRYQSHGDRFDERVVQLSEAVTTALRRIAREHHVTDNTLLEGAWALVLSRSSGLSDVCFGSLMSGRSANLRGIEDMVGMFMNMLPVRIMLREDEQLIPWLKGILDQQTETRAYEFTPLVNVQGWSEVERGRPLFDSAVVYENFPRARTTGTPRRDERAQRKAARPRFVSRERTNYPLTLVSAPGREMRLRINFDRTRFSADAVSRILDHLRVVLEDIAANPFRPLRDFSIMSEAEAERVLVHWNDNRVPVSDGHCAHHLLERRAAEDPGRTALSFEGKSLSYIELDKRANKLARYLRLQGVTIESRVALLLERGPDAIVGMLAILKAGAAYVPVDPNFPRERIEFILGDARPAAVLTRTRHLEGLPRRVPVVCVDADKGAINAQGDTSLQMDTRSVHVALVLYLGGRDRLPTGVQVQHRCIVNSVLAQLTLTNVGRSDRALQMMSLCADPSIGEIFGTLAAGATLHIEHQRNLVPGPRLTRVLREEGITVLTVTPRILSSVTMEVLPQLTTLIDVGTGLTREILARWGDGRRVISVYGSAETGGGAIARVHTRAAGELAIGRPLPNVQIYILDRQLRPVPIGVPGELYIGGVTLARGYLNRPDLTAELFIPNPFSGAGDSQRLYRAGVLARWLPDGQVDRLDTIAQEWVSHGPELDLPDGALRQLHRAFQWGAARSLADQASRDREFHSWLRRLLPVSDRRGDFAFWQKALTGLAPVDLPVDRQRTPVDRQELAEEAFHLPRAVVETIRKFGRAEEVPIFMVVLAAFKVLLGKYSGGDDIAVGTPVANKGNIESESTILGLLPNTLVLRTHVPGGITFREVVRRVRHTCLAASDHYDLPLDQLGNYLSSHIGPTESSIVRVMFGISGDVNDNLRVASASEWGSAALATAHCDIGMHLAVKPRAITGVLLYNEHLWDPGTVARMAQHYARLAQEAVQHPDLPVEDLPLISEGETRRLLVDWNNTSVRFPANPGLLHRLVEAQVERTPDAPALVYADQRLSYREFNARANQLAHRLRKLGVGPESVVGVCANRSIELVVALHAILKAGGAYLPLSSEDPAERLHYLMKDAGVTVVLTQGHLRGKVSGCERLVVLDAEGSDFATEKRTNLDVAMAPANLAYVIYTSGSTGVPKGVMNSHAGICNRLLWMQERYGLREGDTVLQKTPFTFDVSVWEFFWPLLSGASLIVAKPDGHRDPAYLVDVIAQEAVTTAHFVPPMLAAFLDQVGLDRCRSLKRVICSGEALPAELQTRFFTEFGTAAELHNLYGPTEAAIDVTSWACRSEDDRGSVPIGRPIANLRVYVLDHNLHPVPIGVPGELYLAGVGLARGYLGQPGLTAQTFIPDPFARRRGERMYKTGDLCRWTPEGVLDFLGRLDHQVKVRGYRVELGEVESQLLASESVREAVVLTDQDTTGSRRLVAYVVSAQGANPTSAELKSWLLTKLPEYMVPTAFVFLSQLPLTISGKVDRRALPAPALGRAGHLAGYTAPVTPTEEMVADIFREVLNVEEVGREESFFELGGHSLLAASVTSRIRTAFNVEVQLRTLFEAPTVFALAEHIDSTMRNPDQGREPAPSPDLRNREGIVPLSYTQERFWFIAQLAEGSSLNNTSTMIPLSGPFDLSALQSALGELIRRHETLRTTFDVQDGEPVQLIAAPRRPEVAVMDLRRLPHERRQEELKRLQNLEYSTPFDLTRDYGVRFTAVRVEERRQLLLVGIHHIISDGWSLGILAREISVLYGAFRRGEGSPLPELPAQYADYVMWQRAKLGGGLMERQLEYWKSKLQGARRLELITDRPRPPTPGYKSGGIPIVLDSDVTRRLRDFSLNEGVTPFMALLAVFQIVLGRHAGQEDVTVGTVVAGRDRPELERLIGVFINTVAMRTDLSAGATFRDLLRMVRRNVLDAFDNQDVPYDRVVEAIAPGRAVGVQPLFQVLFVLENLPFESVPRSDPGVTKERARRVGTGLQVHSVTALQMYYDLTLTLTDTGTFLGGGLHYSADLFDRETVETLAKHFTTALAWVLDHPDDRITSRTLLSAEEREIILRQWNTSPPASPACIHELVEQSVDRFPNHVALHHADGEISYASLDVQANRIAHWLRGLGVGAETPVAMYLQRGPSAIVVLLAILKAGGCYVPLDPIMPPNRLEVILKDVQPRVVVTEAGLRASLPSCDAIVLCLDDPRNDLERFPVRRLSGVRPSNSAYIIYTSGSTGRPKGVMIEHRSLVNTIAGQIPRFGIDSRSRVLQTLSLAFDASLGEIFRALVAGATLCVPGAEHMRPGRELLDFIREKRIDTATLPTSALGAMPFEQLPELQTLTVGGEGLSSALADRWGTGRRLLNGYGPTEAAVGVTVATKWAHGRRPPLGRLLPNVRGYVLDPEMQLVPPGVPGELYLGGQCLARGYHNRPDLTAQHFVPDVVGEEPGGRLYRTGDRARWLPDGQLDFLGRVDNQVKIRGHRVEPDEISSVLRESQEVRDVAVAASPDGSGELRLAAYVVPVNKAAGAKGASKELVNEWKRASELAAVEYRAAGIADPRLNFSGWRSTYTGEVIPVEEMRDWADAAVARIRDYEPCEVLEIGCGTGLILYRLAPHCRRYVGTDLSASLLEVTRQHLNILHGSGCEVELHHRAADQLEDWPEATFDCVVLNSVVQYFPDSEYLLRVLQSAIALARDGGVVFIGDVRNLELLECFHGLVQLGTAAATTSRSDLIQRVRRHVALERELIVSPELFRRLADESPRVSHLRVMPKGGRGHNELTDFRYDVVLEIARDDPRNVQPTWTEWDWESVEQGMHAIRSALSKNPERLGLRDIPNSRTARGATLLQRLRGGHEFATVAELREAVSHVEAGVEPDDLKILAREAGYEVELSWLGSDVEGKFHAVFWRAGEEPPAVSPPAQVASRSWQELTNNPAEAASDRDRVLRLRDYLLTRVPEYMVPSAFVFLEELPLTSTGKLDLGALPTPDGDERRADRGKPYAPPRTSAEKVLAKIWSDVLQMDRVGIHDNFFELGGDSILSIRVVAKAAESGVKVTSQDAHRYQTIEELAAAADVDAPTATGPDPPSLGRR